MGIIEQRLLRRGIIRLLAEGLNGPDRDAFISEQEQRLNSSLPCPSKQQRRSGLRIVRDD